MDDGLTMDDGCGGGLTMDVMVDVDLPAVVEFAGSCGWRFAGIGIRHQSVTSITDLNHRPQSLVPTGTAGLEPAQER